MTEELQKQDSTGNGNEWDIMRNPWDVGAPPAPEITPLPSQSVSERLKSRHERRKKTEADFSLDSIKSNYSRKEIRKLKKTANEVLGLQESYEKLTDEELRAKTDEFRERLKNGESLDDILPEAFAACREATWRVDEKRQYPVQILAGILLHQGRIAEMKTGEGKTHMSTLPAYLNALTGEGVHIVTANEYLAKRDSEWMGKIYNFMGLSVGLVERGMPPHSAVRRNAYAADITYGANNQVGYDYLHDNTVQSKEDRVQRGHNFAIVDEVDSILIDEARTELVLSNNKNVAPPPPEISLANEFASGLHYHIVNDVNSKKSIDRQVPQGAHVLVDKKARTATLTQDGIAKAEQYFGGLGYENPMENEVLSNQINQAIKAYGVMTDGTDYIVRNRQIMPIDQLTGRVVPNQRYGEGLHQAIQAKEAGKGVVIEGDASTEASMSVQNYFRLYKKLSGMTGTGITERDEFRQVYNMDVVEVPTNKRVIRKDHPDIAYRTEAEKLRAVIRQISACREKGQPVLVGTTSVEKSLVMSQMLTEHGIEHRVLNAANDAEEAEIIAQSGRFGMVTIATNMAGRGTDIKLGGNAEYMAETEMRHKLLPDGERMFSDEMITQAKGFGETDDEEVLVARRTFQESERRHKEEIEPEAQRVRDAGGLFVLGTERYEARRIDNQLRGRAGRQGDPGESRFILSMEDDLVRIYGGQQIASLMGRLNIPENQPLSGTSISNMFERSQKNQEGANFAYRKHVLQYDDVIKRQREVIYRQRNQVLDGDNLRPAILDKMIGRSLEESVDLYCPTNTDRSTWDIDGLCKGRPPWLISPDDFQGDDIDQTKIKQLMIDRLNEHYGEKATQLGDTMDILERRNLLSFVDDHWTNYVDAVTELRRSIGLRAYAQRDPVVEYRMETSKMFDEMNHQIRDDMTRRMLIL